MQSSWISSAYVNRNIRYIKIRKKKRKLYIEITGFKSEWATVKDDTLIVGGLGKEWTTAQGELVNHNPQWVKTISTRGFVEHHDWTRNYEKLREAIGIFFPGE